MNIKKVLEYIMNMVIMIAFSGVFAISILGGIG